MLTPTQDTPSTEIVDPAAMLGAYKGNLEGAHKARRERLKAREENTTVLEDGFKVYPDVLPGTGWVLEAPGGLKRYWATRDLCMARWEQVRFTPKNV